MKMKILLFGITLFVAHQAQSFSSLGNNKKLNAKVNFTISYIGQIKPVLTEIQNKPEDTVVYLDTNLSIKPEFPGGVETFNAHINIFLKKTNNKKNTVFVTFVVEKNGELTNISISRGIESQTNQQTEKEIIDIIKNSPRWKPGERLGEKVRSMVPVFLTIDGKY